LFYDVQSNEHIFSDSKTFIDAVPLFDVITIRDRYSKLDHTSDAAITDFIRENFSIPDNKSDYKSDSSSIHAHITKLWATLERPPDKKVSGTLIPLPYPYVVPGGRFREMYYWDSYFTILGLQADNQIETVQHVIDNLSYLINLNGFIPNGTRTYYESRSQPPFYAFMIDVLAASKGDSIYTRYLNYLEKEYAFWMDGVNNLNDTIRTFRRVVRLPDGKTLNRYWDDKSTPRAESFREDNGTADEAILKIPNCKREDVFRNLRAAAESGWDFSSRWLSVEGFKLYTIHTTDIVPVDLNSLLYHLEFTLAKTYELANNTVKANFYRTKYELRKKEILKYCWNSKQGFFMDYNFKKETVTTVYSLAGVYPLFVEMADKKQAYLVAKRISQSFLKAGGVVTTSNNTGQQWDSPNGWAPLQWITIQGLRYYSQDSLANIIKQRWISLNLKVYNNTYKLLEKYNVLDLSEKGGGGEYPNQDGFGWTNGVYQKLSHETPLIPDHPSTLTPD